MKVVVVVGLLILVHVFAGDRGLPALLQARRDAARLSAEILVLRTRNAALANTIHSLRSDPATIESVARETLGLARTDEIVVTTARP